MKEITFNIGNTYQAGNTPMKVGALDKINIDKNIKDKNQLPWLQMFNSGIRETKDAPNWSKWNGCVYSDIDSKHYYEECKQFKADNLFKMLLEQLRYDYFDNFYAMQLSNSGTGYHIVFYFDVEKTELNFNKCNQFTQNAVKDAFHKIGAGDIYDWKNVADKCSRSPYQGMFVTIQEWAFSINETDTFGAFQDINDYELEVPEPEKIYKSSDVKSDGTKLFILDKYVKQSGSVPYQGHHTRWAIYDALVAVFNNKDIADQEWSKHIVPMLQNEVHSEKFLINEPNKNKWFSKYTTEYVKVDKLQQFGYSFKKVFEPKVIDMYNPDFVYNLKENERLSDAKIQWSQDKINHLYAGCSLGKTYNAKQIGKRNDISDIDYAFGARNNRVCFISPMRSINKDSFNNIEGWEIIDSDHNAENIAKYGSIKELLNIETNICTTWESFVLYQMYNIKFDFVIVDEIHTFYMYDYRIKSIAEMKTYLPVAQGIKIIMTGTPSMEVNDFDCYKIQVNKSLKKVDCDIVFYNKSFRGYYMNDIKDWIQNKNHYAILFEDNANYKYEHLFKCYGIDCDIFNSNYTDNVNYVLDNHTVKTQVTVFSVYGQAGINLYIDTTKKVRIYIMSTTGLGIIQYANRVRNREVIDKIVVGYKYSKINNDINALVTEVDYDEVETKINMLNSIKKQFDIFEVRTKDAIRLRFGLNSDYLDKIDNYYTLNKKLYKTYQLIKNVEAFESQIQVIYNRLINNDFNVNFVDLINDVKDVKRTKMRNNTFAGQMVNFDYDMLNPTKEGKWWLDPTDNFKKICTGDLVEKIEYIWNQLSIESDFDNTKEKFEQFITNTVAVKNTISKKDITDFAQLLYVKANWEKYYNNAFIVAMLDERWTINMLTTAYVRSIYNNIIDWKVACEETYKQMKQLRTIVDMYTDIFFDLEDSCEPLNIENDDITKMIYTFVCKKYELKGNNRQEVKINNVVYGSVTEAAKALGVSRKYIYKHNKS